MTRQETPSIQSLDRGLVILEAVARSPDPVSVAELTNLLRVNHSSAFRLANTLRRRAYLACPAGRKEYVLGPSLWRLFQRYDWRTMLSRVARDHLKLLATRTNQTAHLAMREGKHALYIDHASPNRALGQTGELAPLYYTAHGKALLAGCSRADLRAIFDFEKPDPLSLNEFVDLCAQVEDYGYATEDEEYQEGIRCVAAPIRCAPNLVIGSIGISAPLYRFPQDRYPIYGNQVAETARQLTKLLSNDASRNQRY